VGDRSKVALFKTLGAVMERLPERVDVAIAKRLATLFGRRSTGARGNLRTNVSHALRVDDHDPDEGLLARFVERGFESYGSTGPRRETAGIKPEHVFSRFRIGEVWILYDAKTKGLGTIIALPHIGSWEWAGRTSTPSASA